MNSLTNFLKRFHRNEEGVIATIIAVSFVGLLITILALTIDLNRTQTGYGKNYNATDAAALATAEWWLKSKVEGIGDNDNPLDFTPSQSSFEAFALSSLEENFRIDNAEDRIIDPTTFEVTIVAPSGEADRFHSVEVSACSDLTTNVARAADLDAQTKVCTTSTAAFELGQLENVEVAFALDFTQSMFFDGIGQNCLPGGNNGCPALSETKAFNLFTTMDYVFDTYFDNGQDSTSFASIVPYAGFVNLYPYAGTGNDGSIVRQNAEDFQLDNVRSAWEEEVLVGNDFAIYRTIDSGNKRHDNNGDYSRYFNLSGFVPFYTSPIASDAGYGDVTTAFPSYNYAGENGVATKDYSYVLNRVPVLKSGDLTALSGIGDSTDILPFENYTFLLEEIKNENRIVDSTNPINPYLGSPNQNETHRKSECYSGLIAAAADQRIEKELYRPGVRGEEEGEIISSNFIANSSDLHNGRNIELHESFAIQPLTNSTTVLKELINRFVTDEFLYRNALAALGNNEDIIIDRQRSRLDKAIDFGAASDTSSIHGLIWSWFSLSSDWQGIWNEKSLTEDFCDEGGTNLEIFADGNNCNNQGSSSALSRTSASLPSEENSKHIILISDGYDIDGLESIGVPETGEANALAGYLNACDAHIPVERVSFNEYVDICERIAEEGENGIKVHTILYDFNADGSNPGNQMDRIESQARFGAGNDFSRFEACSNVTGGEFFQDVAPTDDDPNRDSLRDVLDQIFLGIITDLTPVRLIENETSSL